MTPRGFVRSVAVLAGGTVVAQLIGVAAAPLLTRLYAPEAFGAFGVFLAIVSLATVGVGLRYEAAIPLADRSTEAAAVLVLSLALATGISVFAGLVVWLVLELDAGGVIGPSLSSILWFVPLALFLSGVYQALTFWTTRTEAFAVSARASVAQSATTTAAQVALGIAGGGAAGMSAGYVIGRAGGAAFLLPAVGAVLRGPIREHISARELRAAAARFRRFPLFALWASLLNSASFHVPVLILAGLFEVTVAGWFLLSVRVLQAPLALVGAAVGQVFYARASRSSDADLRSTTSQVYRTLVTLGVGPMVVLALGGAQAFALVFGDEWRHAGEYAQWLAPWLLLVFVASPLSTLVFVQSRQREELVFQLALVGVRTGALLVGWLLGDAGVAIGLFGVSSAILWGIYLAWLLSIGGARVIDSIAHLLRSLGWAIALAVPVVVANVLEIEGLAWVAIAGAVLGVMVIRTALQIGVKRP